MTTQEQLDAVNAAIGQGAEVVRYADGRSVTYRSVDDLQKVRAALLAQLDQETAGASGSRTQRLLIQTDPGL